jgi:hypothetical protein
LQKATALSLLTSCSCRSTIDGSFSEAFRPAPRARPRDNPHTLFLDGFARSLAAACAINCVRAWISDGTGIHNGAGTCVRRRRAWSQLQVCYPVSGCLMLLWAAQGADRAVSSCGKHRARSRRCQRVHDEIRSMRQFRAAEHSLQGSRQRQRGTCHPRASTARHRRHAGAVLHSQSPDYSAGFPSRSTPGIADPCLIPGYRNRQSELVQSSRARSLRVRGIRKRPLRESRSAHHHPRPSGRWLHVELRTEVSSSGSRFECVIVELSH